MRCKQIVQKYKLKHAYSDDKYEFELDWKLKNGKYPKQILLRNGSYSWIISLCFYIIISCLLCSSCYRMWLWSKTVKKSHKIIKQIML